MRKSMGPSYTNNVADGYNRQMITPERTVSFAKAKPLRKSASKRGRSAENGRRVKESNGTSLLASSYGPSTMASSHMYG